MAKDFFQRPKEPSKIKSEIVAKYFATWAKIILGKTSGNIAYIDLFAGPGRYKDGTPSTPLLILEQAIANEDMRKRLVTIFTDKEREFIETLKSEIGTIRGIQTLKHTPQIWQEEVGDRIVDTLQQMKLIPSLVFIDPCGYKGLSLDLVNAVIKDWACECIFFFNFNRINAGIHNDKVEDHINGIFGIERSENLRIELQNKSPYRREKLILKYLVDALKESHGKFVQHFCVKHSDRDRTSHYLVFVTKNFLGYEIMREIMAKCSSSSEQGVPSFEYNIKETGDLFYHPLNELKAMLIEEFQGRRIQMKEVYLEHSPGFNYIKSNYKAALRQLYAENKIEVTSSQGKPPRKGTMGDSVIIQFPAFRIE